MTDLPRPSARLEPATAWTVVTDAPLLGLALAREAGVVLAWDDGGMLYRLGSDGERQAMARASGRIVAAAISDDGSLVAAVVEGSRLWFLDRGLEPIAERTAPPEASNLAIDPHGRFVAVAGRLTTTHFYNRHGRPAGRFETRQALAHVRFVPSLPMVVAAADQGLLVGVELEAGSGGTLEAEVIWAERILSNVGRLETTGDGGVILATCFLHGVQRYDIRGQNEGSYHFGGTASQAVPDFAGRLIAVATIEGELALLNQAGNVRWKTGLGRGPVGLEIDALGRYVVYGHETGEIVRIDLDGRRAPTQPSRVAGPTAAPAVARSGSVREPEWSAPVAQSDEQAETAVLTVLDDPPRIGLASSRNRLMVFTTTGGALGQAPELMGVGRFLRTAPGWIAVATDRQIVLYDARRNGAHRIDLSLAELTHLVIRPDDYGLAIIQERDRIGRATLAGRWIWKHELRSPIEDLALGADGLAAVTDETGQLLVFDAAGDAAGRHVADPVEPLCLVAAPSGAPAGIAWISLARRSQILRGHRGDGRVAWESPIPFEAWQLHRVGPAVVVAAPDGRALAYDGTGYLRAQGRSEDAPAVFFEGPDGTIRRLIRQGTHLICSDLGGHVAWRAVADAPLGPMAAGTAGVAVLIGRSLAWFAAAES